MTRRLLEAKLRELCPSWIRLRLVEVIASSDVEVLATDGAKAGAVDPAEQASRQRQRERVACPAMKVQLVALDVWRGQLFLVSRLGDLAGVDREDGRRLLETAHARSGQRRLEPEPKRIS